MEMEPESPNENQQRSLETENTGVQVDRTEPLLVSDSETDPPFITEEDDSDDLNRLLSGNSQFSLATESRLHSEVDSLEESQKADSIATSNDSSTAAVDELFDQDGREGGMDLSCDEEWKTQKRHVFILSESGKPIYSRFGNEDKLVTLFGLMQALVSVVQDDDDTIRSISIGKVRIVFLLKTPLILVGVSRQGQSISQMQTELMYYYNQVVSILTLKQLEKIYEKRRNYDLRRLLAGSERLLTSLSDSMEDDPSFMLGAVRCLPLANNVRETIANAIIQHTTKLKDVVFAILIAGNQLVTLVRMKKCFMHPMDLLIIRNLVNASESFKTGENWTPICLPRFDPSGFVHAHVSYLTDDCEACLILLTVDRDSFFALSAAKQKIVEKLSNTNCLESITTAIKSSWPTMSAVSIPQIRHFIYKSKHIAQFTSTNLSTSVVESHESPTPSSGEPNSNKGPRACPAFLRLFSTYSKIHARLHNHSRPLRLLYTVGNNENFMGWVTSTFELYLTFEPFTKKPVAIAGVEKLLKWVKKEEDRLFITNSPTF